LTVESGVVDVVLMNDDMGGSLLDGLEELPWNTFGAAGRAVPAALRRLASGDERSALDAVHDLGDTLVCSGLVSNAAPLAIPYMVRLAGSGVCSVELLDLLGFIGMEDASAGGGASRDVLADNIELLRPLLAHEDPDIRESVVLVLSTVGGRSDLERFLELWGTETNIRVRVSLLAGSARLDPDLAVPLIQEAMSQSESEEVRVASLVASAEVGLQWSEERTTTLLSLLPLETHLGRTPWTNTPLEDLVLALARRGEDGQREAVDLMGRLLASAGSSTDAAALYEAVWTAQSLGDEVVGTRASLQPALARLVDSPADKSRVAEGVLRSWRSNTD
jgi:hypothetical protein